MKGRVLALDIGRKKIGVAVSDALRISSNPLGFIDASNTKKALEKIGGLIREYEASEVVIGIPKIMDGSLNEWALRCREIGAEISSSFNVSVKEVDERLSTKEAERLLIDAGMSRTKRKNVNDQIAAAIILRSYLDSQSGV